MNLEVIHVKTCLPDYWSGHHKAHVCVPVWNGMTFNELKSSLHSEIAQGAVCGSDKISELLGLSGGGAFRMMRSRRHIKQRLMQWTELSWLMAQIRIISLVIWTKQTRMNSVNRFTPTSLLSASKTNR